jgi:hypothetical protein
MKSVDFVKKKKNKKPKKKKKKKNRNEKNSIIKINKQYNKIKFNRRKAIKLAARIIKINKLIINSLKKRIIIVQNIRFLNMATSNLNKCRLK